MPDAPSPPPPEPAPPAQPPRVSSQALRVLEAIRQAEARGAGATADDLALVAVNYRARVSELRTAGFAIRAERDAAGGYRYVEAAGAARRVAPKRGAPRYFFLVGPPAQAHISPPYATAAARDAAAVDHYNAYECVADQFFWLDDAGLTPRVGPMEIAPAPADPATEPT